MTMQVRNPLKFWCAPNQATPDYVVYDDFRQFIAYGLICCWCSHDPNDPNADANMARAITRDDVKELRGYFLDLVETVVTSLWKGQYSPGDGSIDGDWEHLIIGPEGNESGDNDTMLTWYIRLDDDAMMFSLDCTGADSENIWLGYKGIEDRAEVLKVLTEARQTIDDVVWQDLINEVNHPSVVVL